MSARRMKQDIADLTHTQGEVANNVSRFKCIVICSRHEPGIDLACFNLEYS